MAVTRMTKKDRESVQEKRRQYKEARKLPAWAAPVDCETVVELTLQLFDKFYGEKATLECEDSRALTNVIIELADIVAERNGIDNPDYWREESADWMSEVTAVAETFLEICTLHEPDWINSNFHGMYGNEFVSDLFARHQVIAELRLSMARKPIVTTTKDGVTAVVEKEEPTSAEVLASPFKPLVPREKVCVTKQSPTRP